MGLSDYNRIHERILVANLNENEMRLALAFVRCLIGWKRRAGIPNEGRLGRVRLRQVAAGNFEADPFGPIMDNRTFDRSLTGLREADIVEVLEPGKPGKGNRTRYGLCTTTQKVAPQRPFVRAEKVAPQRPKAVEPNGRAGDAQKVALARLRKGYRKEKTPATPDHNDLRRRCFDAYTGAGGSLRLDRERSALARGVTSLVKAGIDEEIVVAACRECGRRQEFPGFLKQRAEELARDGLPCIHGDNPNRLSLTAAQLAECPCPHCVKYLGYKRESTAVAR